MEQWIKLALYLVIGIVFGFGVTKISELCNSHDTRTYFRGVQYGCLAALEKVDRNYKTSAVKIYAHADSLSGVDTSFLYMVK